MATLANPERIETLALELERTLTGSIARIRDLNDRTHVLAINARIEAARAGVAGRGFRVVADAFGALNLEIQQVSAQITDDSAQALAELLSISRELSGTVRGQRLVQLAEAAMDVVDRNLYERSCDVRWWAHEPTVAQALVDPALHDLASRRLGTILESYTVYADIVVADPRGRIVVHGRPGTGAEPPSMAQEPWFTQALGLREGFGFQSVHQGALAGGIPVLVYSCPVRPEGDEDGPPLGVLAVVFRWEGLGKVILEKTALALDGQADLALVEPGGRLLARWGTSDQTNWVEGPGVKDLMGGAGAGFRIEGTGSSRFIVGRGVSPGFETYATGWSCLIRQRL